MTQHDAHASVPVEAWFDFGSQYSYLSLLRIGEVARVHGVQVQLRPFLLGPVFRSLGWSTSPFVLQKAKGEYAWRDVQRRAAGYGLPWRGKPAAFPRSSVLPARIAQWAGDQPWCLAFCQAVFRLNFLEDREIDAPEPMRALLAGMGLPASAILEEAQSEANKLRLRARTQHAQDIGIFGAPSFIVAGELFWGDDRMEDAFAHAARVPFRDGGPLQDR